MRRLIFFTHYRLQLDVTITSLELASCVYSVRTVSKRCDCVPMVRHGSKWTVENMNDKDFWNVVKQWRHSFWFMSPYITRFFWHLHGIDVGASLVIVSSDFGHAPKDPCTVVCVLLRPCQRALPGWATCTVAAERARTGRRTSASEWTPPCLAAAGTLMPCLGNKMLGQNVVNTRFGLPSVLKSKPDSKHCLSIGASVFVEGYMFPYSGPGGSRPLCTGQALKWKQYS